MSALRQSRPSRGYTLTEIMTVLSVASILIALGVPSFRSVIQTQRLTATVNELFAAVNLTRSEAIRRGTRVDLVPAGDGRDWSKGWIVLVDHNHNQQADAGEPIIFSHGPAEDGVTIQSDFLDTKAQYLAFNPSGRTQTNANSQTPQSGNWLVSTGQEQRKIIINFLGRARTCNPEREKASC